MTTIGLSYSLVKRSTKCAPALIGSGPLQGFSITLILGLLSSMITGIWGTRAIINPIWGHSSRKLLRV